MTEQPLITVDTSDATPPYEQLRRQLAAAIEHGHIQPDERLPPVRQLAGDLALAVGTVARAYRELERAGLVLSRRGGGTRAVGNGRTGARRIDQLAKEYVSGGRAIGCADTDLLDAVRAALVTSSGPPHTQATTAPERR